MNPAMNPIEATITVLRTTQRQGVTEDAPEGARYIAISDTLAVQLADELEAFQKQIGDDIDMAGGLAKGITELTVAINEHTAAITEQIERDRIRTQAKADATATFMRLRRGR